MKENPFNYMHKSGKTITVLVHFQYMVFSSIFAPFSKCVQCNEGGICIDWVFFLYWVHVYKKVQCMEGEKKSSILRGNMIIIYPAYSIKSVTGQLGCNPEHTCLRVSSIEHNVTYL